VDVFRGALGGIVRKPTRTIIGEAGPKAVLPLSSKHGFIGHYQQLYYRAEQCRSNRGTAPGSFFRAFVNIRHRLARPDAAVASKPMQLAPNWVTANQPMNAAIVMRSVLARTGYSTRFAPGWQNRELP
jgi:hypothetical protein